MKQMCLYAYSYMALGIALRYVLEALKQVPGKKMYMFGLTALDKFKTRSALILSKCDSLSRFQSKLKTYFFHKAFD